MTGVRQVIMSQSSLFLLRFSCFSCIKSSVIVARFWLISRVFKKLILTIIASQCSHCFYREQIFRDSYSALQEVLLSHHFLYVSVVS